MRLLLSLIVWFAYISIAEAKSPRIERIEVQGAGIVKLTGKLKTIKDRAIISGTRTESATKIVQQTTEVPAKLDTVFGVDFKMVGVRKGQTASIRIVWRYPEPGLKNPSNGTTKLYDEYDDKFTAGNSSNTIYWNLAADWTLVPGVWSVELLQDNRRLMFMEFTLVK